MATSRTVSAGALCLCMASACSSGPFLDVQEASELQASAERAAQAGERASAASKYLECLERCPGFVSSAPLVEVIGEDPVLEKKLWETVERLEKRVIVNEHPSTQIDDVFRVLDVYANQSEPARVRRLLDRTLAEGSPDTYKRVLLSAAQVFPASLDTLSALDVALIREEVECAPSSSRVQAELMRLVPMPAERVAAYEADGATSRAESGVTYAVVLSRAGKVDIVEEVLRAAAKGASCQHVLIAAKSNSDPVVAAAVSRLCAEPAEAP